jgi:hypothetical protein
MVFGHTDDAPGAIRDGIDILEHVWAMQRLLYRLRSGVVAPPISYAVNGKRYVAVAAGPKWNAATRPASLKYANACSMVYVFTL